MMARDDRDRRHKDRRDMPGSSIDKINRYRNHSHSRPFEEIPLMVKSKGHAFLSVE
jgi:hypothetical protein